MMSLIPALLLSFCCTMCLADGYYPEYEMDFEQGYLRGPGAIYNEDERIIRKRETVPDFNEEHSFGRGMAGPANANPDPDFNPDHLQHEQAMSKRRSDDYEDGGEVKSPSYNSKRRIFPATDSIRRPRQNNFPGIDSSAHRFQRELAMRKRQSDHEDIRIQNSFPATENTRQRRQSNFPGVEAVRPTREAHLALQETGRGTPQDNPAVMENERFTRQSSFPVFETGRSPFQNNFRAMQTRPKRQSTDYFPGIEAPRYLRQNLNNFGGAEAVRRFSRSSPRPSPESNEFFGHRTKLNKRSNGRERTEDPAEWGEGRGFNKKRPDTKTATNPKDNPELLQDAYEPQSQQQTRHVRPSFREGQRHENPNAGYNALYRNPSTGLSQSDERKSLDSRESQYDDY